MPRRSKPASSTKHGKGNSATRPSKGSLHQHKAKKTGSMVAWETRDDIPMDNQEKFHRSREKILLNGDDSDVQDDGNGGEDDEVFALDGLAQDSDSDSEEHVLEEVEEFTPKSTTISRKKSKLDVHETSSESGDSELDHWGSKQSNYYSTNAALLSSDDEEANEMEEKEVLRLQSKTRADLGEEDYGTFGVGNLEADENSESDPISATPIDSALPQDTESLIRHLELNRPETLALARDWADIANQVIKVGQAVNARPAEDPAIGLMHLHHQTLLTYATTLAFYLHLQSSPQTTQNSKSLVSHPIMGRLLSLKRGLNELEALGFSALDGDGEVDSDMSSDSEEMAGFKVGKRLPNEELESLLFDALDRIGDTNDNNRSPLHTPKTVSKKPKPRQKPTKSTDAPVFDLVEPTFLSRSSTRALQRQSGSDDYGFGDPTSLQLSDIKDKDARKKSLRFHTSKIESVSHRREKARVAHGGDDDIPYKERNKEKQLRLQRDMKERGMGGDDLEPMEGVQPEGKKRTREELQTEEVDEDGDGYYELVKRQKKERKDEKKEAYELERASQIIVPTDNSDGPRSLTRNILSNRGLTAHRNKTARNPRVKKRQQFEKAKKRLSSKKAIYKGGLASTAGKYEGEKSGIASRVIKSVKLS